MAGKQVWLALVAAAVTGMLAIAEPAAAAPPDARAADRTAVADEAARPQLIGPDSAKVSGFVAVPAGGGLTAAQQSPTECLWGWDVEVGGFYPEAWLRYAATFECGSLVIPDVAGVLQGSLHASPGGLRLHQGPEESFLFFGGLILPPASSGGEVSLAGPGSFFINSNSIVDLLPSDETGIWIWSYLPPGCTGVGTPRAVCDIDSTSFDIT